MAIGAREGITHIFEILEEIGDGLSLAICENRLVQAIAGFSCERIRGDLAGGKCLDGRVVPPQHEELQMPISEVGAEESGRQSVVDAVVARASKAHGLSTWS